MTTKPLAAWVKAGTAVEATSASDAARQAGLDWTVSMHDMHADYPIMTDAGLATKILPVDIRKAIVKTTPLGESSVVGVVGNKYKIFQNDEIFSSLDAIVDSGEARYAAAGEYDGGAKVWMLMSLPKEVNVAGDPHAAFLLAKTTHDGSGSVTIRPVIERLFCMNQINGLLRRKSKMQYRLPHTINSQLSSGDIRNILQISYDSIEEYETIAGYLQKKEVSRQQAVEYFKRVWALPSKIENTPHDLLTKGEKTAKTRALKARQTALNIYEQSETQANIHGTAFGLWHAVVEYTDHNSSKTAAVAALAQRNDNIKYRGLELLGITA